MLISFTMLSVRRVWPFLAFGSFLHLEALTTLMIGFGWIRFFDWFHRFLLGASGSRNVLLTSFRRYAASLTKSLPYRHTGRTMPFFHISWMILGSMELTMMWWCILPCCSVTATYFNSRFCALYVRRSTLKNFASSVLACWESGGSR